MMYAVHLRDTVSGATRIVKEQCRLFDWAENNYSCDCNRSRFLYDNAEEYRLPCSADDNVIVVDGIYDPDGHCVYSET